MQRMTHEHFRRILCNTIADYVIKGEYPHDRETLESLVEGICYRNAVAYFEKIPRA